MPLGRLGLSGEDFTVTLWNNNASLIENLPLFGIGVGILSGMVLSDEGGFDVGVSDGYVSMTVVKEITGISNITIPASSTSFIWIDESGTLTRTATDTYPGGTVACVGRVETDGSGITSILYDNRYDIILPKDVRGSMASVALTGGEVILTPSQYKCPILSLSGTLTSNVELVVPPNRGWQWLVRNATTGAYTVKVKTFDGTGVDDAPAQGTSCSLWCDGTDVLRATADL